MQIGVLKKYARHIELSLLLHWERRQHCIGRPPSSVCEKDRVYTVWRHISFFPPLDIGFAIRFYFAVIPYIHGYSHPRKKVASRCNIDVVFNAKNELSSICPALHKCLRNKGLTRQTTCNTNHSIAFVSCVRNVVYLILFSCDHCYAGQMGRCLNIRLREHHGSLKNAP